jgi:hypothetical protein
MSGVRVGLERIGSHGEPILGSHPVAQLSCRLGEPWLGEHLPQCSQSRAVPVPLERHRHTDAALLEVVRVVELILTKGDHQHGSAASSRL